MKARCQCGQLSVDLPGPAPAVVACHCTSCQRRTGSPFGVLAYYPSDRVTIAGDATRFVRLAATGTEFEPFFCPVCGSTVYVRAAKHPTMIGVAVGVIADPEFQPPVRSVWEEGMHRWVSIPSAVEHLRQGRPG